MSLILAQAHPPNCYHPESPRVCQVVNNSIESAQPPQIVSQPSAALPAPQAGVGGASAGGSGGGASLAGLSQLAPILGIAGAGIPLGMSGLGGSNGPSSNNSQNSPFPNGNPGGRGPSRSAPFPMALPGIIAGVGLALAARRNRVSLMAMPLFFTTLAPTPPVGTAPAPQEMVIPVISNNQMAVNYGGRAISLPVPFGMPQDTTKHRYYVQSTGNGWQICWEEIKPLVCPPKGNPGRALW